MRISNFILAVPRLCAMATSGGAKVTLMNANEESCACLNWYPDVRGEKQQFEQVDQ